MATSSGLESGQLQLRTALRSTAPWSVLHAQLSSCSLEQGTYAVSEPCESLMQKEGVARPQARLQGGGMALLHARFKWLCSRSPDCRLPGHFPTRQQYPITCTHVCALCCSSDSALCPCLRESGPASAVKRASGLTHCQPAAQEHASRRPQLVRSPQPRGNPAKRAQSHCGQGCGRATPVAAGVCGAAFHSGAPGLAALHSSAWRAARFIPA